MGHDQLEGLSDEDIRRENAFLAGVPFFNLGAMFMPPIWGAGHGEFIPILFYPLWLFTDNILYSAWSAPSVLSIVAAVLVFIVMTAVTLVYARLSSPRSAHRAEALGKTREQYLKAERRWAIGMAVLAIACLALATWYNLSIRPYLG